MKAGAVSIVIPTCNGGATLGRLLAALRSQVGVSDVQIVAVDSGSRDGTRELLEAHGAEVVTIEPGTFNHGATRNQGLAHATGEFAVLIVQDAVPASEGWLAALVQPLARDARVAGSFARQQPWPAASAVTAHYLGHWVASRCEPRVVGPLAASEWAAMSPSERHLACAFDNVCACIRMEAWRAHPFRPAPIAEDLAWAQEVLLAGWKLAYAPEAQVWHSHERSAAYELQRTYLVHQRLQSLFGLSTVPTAGALMRSVMTTLPLHVKLAARERQVRVRTIGRAAALAVALPLGQYLGARSAREGRELLRTKGI